MPLTQQIEWWTTTPPSGSHQSHQPDVQRCQRRRGGRSHQQPAHSHRDVHEHVKQTAQVLQPDASATEGLQQQATTSVQPGLLPRGWWWKSGDPVSGRRNPPRRTYDSGWVGHSRTWVVKHTAFTGRCPLLLLEVRSIVCNGAENQDIVLECRLMLNLSVLNDASKTQYSRGFCRGPLPCSGFRITTTVHFLGGRSSTHGPCCTKQSDC